MPLLYKYRGLGDETQFKRLERTLSTGNFWFANASEVNDPFEFRCAISFTWDIEQTADAFALVEMHLSPGCTYSQALTKARTVLGRVSTSKLHERQWELSYNMWKACAQAATMCCLAGDPTSLLMWSHYANGHSGVAIEIDVPAEQIIKRPLAEVHEVEYSDELPQINPRSLVGFHKIEEDGAGNSGRKMGLGIRGGRCPSERFETLARLLGDRFVRTDVHRETLAFLKKRLKVLGRGDWVFHEPLPARCWLAPAGYVCVSFVSIWITVFYGHMVSSKLA